MYKETDYADERRVRVMPVVVYARWNDRALSIMPTVATAALTFEVCRADCTKALVAASDASTVARSDITTENAAWAELACR